MTFIESKKKEGKLQMFLSSATGFESADGKEFIAIGTSDGVIHFVDVNGTAFTKDVGYTF